MSGAEVVITTIHPDDPALAIQLEAKPPVIGTTYSGDPRNDDWTLDLLERTIFEFRAAGAWDGSRVEFKGYPSAVKCEVLAQRGEDAMPWGWRPSHGRPAEATQPTHPERPARRRLTGLLANSVIHGVLLLMLLVLVAVTR